MHNNVKDLIESALNSKLLSINLKSQRLVKEKLEVKNIVEQQTKRRTRITESMQNFKIIHKKSSISLNNTSQIFLVIPNTSDLPTEVPANSLSIGDEHLSTIPETESDEVIKSSVKNLLPILSKFEVTFDNEKLIAEISDATTKFFSQSPIPVEDSDSQMEEIDLFLATDDLMPSGIENDGYDSKGDIHFLE
uniref:Reverse transcriptase domain-containing protein n=1 Tax=Tanacetum cinerariifolium TaxID=118510 RepID=A0A6L2K1B7_TANCI|nr:hypothetical protein [Tanacetum cinerariifolium]